MWSVHVISEINLLLGWEEASMRIAILHIAYRLSALS